MGADLRHIHALRETARIAAMEIRTQVATELRGLTPPPCASEPSGPPWEGGIGYRTGADTPPGRRQLTGHTPPSG